MRAEDAIQAALGYIRARPEFQVIETPTCKLIPARYRPDLDATTDAWAVSFPFANVINRLPHHAPLVIPIDVVSVRLRSWM